MVRVTFFRQCPGAALWYLGRRPGDCCALFFTARGLAVRQSAASGSAGLARPESAMSSSPSSHKLTDRRATTQGVTGVSCDAGKPGSLQHIPPPVERHPTGPDTAAQPGERAPCSVCVSELSPLQKLIIQIQKHRVDQVTTL